MEPIPSWETINQKKEEFIQSEKKKQEKLRLKVDELKEECLVVNEKIVSECSAFKTTTTKLRDKALQFIDSCQESLNETNNKEIVEIKQLAGYLKVQKEQLKTLSTQEQKTKRNELDLHVLVSRAKFQNILREVKKKEMEEEIKYLQTNVISKGRLIYNPAVAPTITQTQQKQLRQRIENSIQQLERVITLSLPCRTFSDQSQNVEKLKQQTTRLKQCEAMLAAEYQKINKIMKYFRCKNSDIINQLPYPTEDPFLQQQLPNQYHTEQQRIPEYELDEIINFPIPKGRLLSKLSHPFEDWEDKIEHQRKKYRKIQKLM